MKKRIGILGSTGSIGTQTLQVIAADPDRYEVVVITGHRNVDRLLDQSLEFNVPHVVITDHDAYEQARRMNFEATLHEGIAAANAFIDPNRIDLVLNALVGNIGLMSTYTAVSRKVPLALANKESLVTGGAIISRIARDNNQTILPVDSEHSAIFQCLRGNDMNTVEKLVITASGGPFRELPVEEIRKKRSSEALKHPNWAMGRKISIDSATMVNKGLEVMEARWLFDIPGERIQVVVHPQSIIHSLVQYRDTSVIAQMGLPDMRLPIHYALNYPNRRPIPLDPFDFTKPSGLSFEPPRWDAFPGLALAYEALEKGGSMPTVYNTVNEMLVSRYLADEIGFYDITDGIVDAMANHALIGDPTIEDLIALDREIRSRYKQGVKTCL